MAQAIFPIAIFGTELQGLTVHEHDSVRSVMTHVLWQGNTWYRCFALTYTHIAPAFRVLAKPASIYHSISLARRLLIRRQDLHQMFVDVWHSAVVTANGPIHRLWRCVQDLSATWISPVCIQTREGARLNLLHRDKGTFLHDLRDAIRSMHDHQERQACTFPSRFARRTELFIPCQCGTPETRKIPDCEPPQLTLFDFAALRSLLTGVTRTNEPLHKSGKLSTPECTDCDQRARNA